jgi:hypothetical protein
MSYWKYENRIVIDLPMVAWAAIAITVFALSAAALFG